MKATSANLLTVIKGTKQFVISIYQRTYSWWLVHCKQLLDKKVSIALKLSKAKNRLEKVGILMEHQFYITTINRLYYSCFHATKSLLLTKNLISKTYNRAVVRLNQYLFKIVILVLNQVPFLTV